MTIPTGGTERQNDSYEPAPPKNTKRWWLIGGALAVVVAVIVTVVVVNSSDPSLTADAKLEKGLLDESGFPGGYTVSVLTQDELDKAMGQDQSLPEGISPPECAELLRDQPKLTGDTPVGAAKAEGSGTYYVEMITPADGITAWDTSKATEVVDKCANTTINQDGQTGTLTMSLLDPPAGSDAFVMKFGIEAEGQAITLLAAVSKVGKHAVAVIGASSSEVDDAEFLGIVTAANEKAEQTL